MLSIFFIIWIILRTFSLSNTKVDIQEQFYRNYVQSTLGKTDEEIVKMITSEMERFNALNKEISEMLRNSKEKEEGLQITMQLSQISKQLESKAAFERMVKDYYRIAAINKAGKSDKLLSLEYGSGVNRLTANDYHSITQDHVTAMGLIICMIACFSSIFVSEKSSNAIEIQKVTPKGKSYVVKYKLMFAIIITSIGSAK